MMPCKKTLTLREIQRISNTITFLKGSTDKDGKEIVPNYIAKWDASTQYWMGRLSNFCEPIVNRISETRDNLVRKHGRKLDKGGYEILDDEAFNAEIKALLDGTDTIRFPEFKTSAFVKMKDKKVIETLVPIDFWETFSRYIETDVEEFQVAEEESN